MICQDAKWLMKKKVGDIKGESLSAHRWYAVQDKQPLVKLLSKLKTMQPQSNEN